MRLIDADALMEKRRSFYEPRELESIVPIASTCITTDDVYWAPTIDAVPVVHARFEENRMNYRCTACGTDFSDEIAFIYPGEDKLPAYCPNCGAKMDGGAEG